MRRDIAEIIAGEPMVLTRTGWTYHPPLPDGKGGIRYGYPEYDVYTGISRRFRKAGVRVNLTNLPTGWIDEGIYRYEEVDRTLEALFSAVPDALYIPRLRLDPPLAWLEKHPEAVCLFEQAPRDLSKITALVREGRVNGTYDATAAPEPRGIQPLIRDAPIGMQSFSSERWIRDAEAALASVIDHLLNSSYASRIIGFHIGFGWTGELLAWGRDAEHLGDHSAGNVQAFFDWALSRYGSLDALRCAWEQPELCAENAFVPTKAWRYYQAGNSVWEMLRADGRGRFCEDYERFYGDTVATAMERLARRAKLCAPDIAVGTFYGYFMASATGAAINGQLELERLLKCADIDYFAGPKSYANPRPGEAGGTATVVRSVLRRKIWIDELDNRTHLAEYQYVSSSINVESAQNLTETRTVLWRELCKNEQYRANYWWMDQGRAGHEWYADDGIMEIVAQNVRTHALLAGEPGEDFCEVLALIDEDAMYGVQGFSGASPHKDYLSDFLMHQHMSGVPCDVYRLSDIQSLPLERYKLVILLNPERLSEETHSALMARIEPDCRVMFNHLPGICASGFSLDNVARHTGMVVTEDAMASDYPRFVIRDGYEEALRLKDGNALLARRGNVYLNLLPGCPASLLRKIAVDCGTRPFLPCDGIVYGNTRLVGVFSLERIGLDTMLTLPERGDWTELTTGTLYLDTASVPIVMGPKEGRVFFRGGQNA